MWGVALVVKPCRFGKKFRAGMGICLRDAVILGHVCGRPHFLYLVASSPELNDQWSYIVDS